GGRRGAGGEPARGRGRGGGPPPGGGVAPGPRRGGRPRRRRPPPPHVVPQVHVRTLPAPPTLPFRPAREQPVQRRRARPLVLAFGPGEGGLLGLLLPPAPQQVTADDAGREHP